MKVKLTKVYVSDKKKDGSPLINKNGKSYKKIGIQTAEHGDKWLSGFFNFDMKEWAAGSLVDIEVEQNGQWLNFKTPNRNVSREEFDTLKAKVDTIERMFLKPPQKEYDTTKKEDRDHVVSVSG